MIVMGVADEYIMNGGKTVKAQSRCNHSPEGSNREWRTTPKDRIGEYVLTLMLQQESGVTNPREPDSLLCRLTGQASRGCLQTRTVGHGLW
jgi:hypothetical protein